MNPAQGVHIVREKDVAAIKGTAAPALIDKVVTSSKRQRRKRKRGPKGSSTLDCEQFTGIQNAAHCMARAGHPVNVQITLTTPDDITSIADQKRYLTKRVDRLREAHVRAGLSFEAISVFEANLFSAGVHVHIVAHACSGSRLILRRWHDGDLCDVTYKGAAAALRYVTKQRRPFGDPGNPDSFEARLLRDGWHRKGKGHVPGPRLILSPDLRALIALPAIAQPRQAPAVPVSVAPVQLALFDAGLPALPPPAFDLAAERKRRGLTQSAIGQLINLRQPHIANVERGHDRLSPARIRVLRHILDGLQVAA